jgi:hypothetical protein
VLRHTQLSGFGVLNTDFSDVEVGMTTRSPNARCHVWLTVAMLAGPALSWVD